MRRISYDESRSKLPAINLAKRPSLVDNSYEAKQDTTDSKTFFTESMTNFRKRIDIEEEEEAEEEEENEARENGEHKEADDDNINRERESLSKLGLLENKHESAVDKVCT